MMKIFLPVSLLLPTASIFNELPIVKDSHVHACVCVCVCIHTRTHMQQQWKGASILFSQNVFSNYILPVEDAHTTEADTVYISFSTSVT